MSCSIVTKTIPRAAPGLAKLRREYGLTEEDEDGLGYGKGEDGRGSRRGRSRRRQSRPSSRLARLAATGATGRKAEPVADGPDAEEDGLSGSGASDVDAGGELEDDEEEEDLELMWEDVDLAADAGDDEDGEESSSAEEDDVVQDVILEPQRRRQEMQPAADQELPAAAVGRIDSEDEAINHVGTRKLRELKVNPLAMDVFSPEFDALPLEVQVCSRVRDCGHLE